MHTRSVLLVLIFGTWLSVSSGFGQSKSDKDTKPVEIRGCVAQGVETGCLVLTAKNGKTYSLHGTDLPSLDKKLVVWVKGTAGGVDPCMQGTVVQVSSWGWTRMRCPQTKKETSPQ
jgi:hypothetical protein